MFFIICDRLLSQMGLQTLCLLFFILRLSDMAPIELHDKKIIFNLLWKIVLFFIMRISTVMIEEDFLYHCLDAPRKLPVSLMVFYH